MSLTSRFVIGGWGGLAECVFRGWLVPVAGKGGKSAGAGVSCVEVPGVGSALLNVCGILGIGTYVGVELATSDQSFLLVWCFGV